MLIVSVVVTLVLNRKSNLDLFWAPVTQQSGPVLICMGQPLAYSLLSAQAQDRLHRTMRQPPLEPATDEALARKDLVILPDRYVALGDAICLVRLTALFERYGKPYRVRGQRSTSFADLRENPAVLIAAFDNEWTLHTADWPKKNLQIVLRVPVVRGAPGRPRVLATQVW